MTAAPSPLGDAPGLARVFDPLRDTLPTIGDDPAEERAGHRNGPDCLVQAFGTGACIGLPILRYRGIAARADAPQFPTMRAWLRAR